MSIEYSGEPDDKNPFLKAPKLQLITGGKGPPNKPDWFADLNVGDIFLARHIREAEKNFELNTFCVMFKGEKSTKLLVYLSDKERMVRWVDTKTFSREMLFNEVIGNADVDVTTEPED
jgi:hypothetical protein